MPSQHDFDNFPVEFDIQALREWSELPYTKFVMQEIKRMANVRMNGLRAALHSKDADLAMELNGELNALEEILQLPDLIIDDWKSFQNEKGASEK